MNKKQYELIAQYYIEAEKKANKIPYNQELLKSLCKQLKEEGILEKTLEFTERSIKASKALKNGESIEEVIKIQTGRER